jgi:dGTPase
VAAAFSARGSPSLEAQLCNLADEIAYNAHDIDDGVRSGLLTLEQMAEVPLFERYRRRRLPRTRHSGAAAAVRVDPPDAQRPGLRRDRHHPRAAWPSGVECIDRGAGPGTTAGGFSKDMRTESQELKRFLLRNLYRHPR